MKSEWESEKNYYFFEVDGYKCEIARAPNGHLCGYVTLPKTSELHGVRLFNLNQIDVHGGITFSEFIKDHWTLGFDCAHLYDYAPHISMTPQHKIPCTIKYRNVEYVTAELHKLVAQIKDIDEGKVPFVPSRDDDEDEGESE